MSHPPTVVRLLASRDANERDEAWRSFLSEYSRLLLHVCRSIEHDQDRAMDAYAHLLERLRADDCARLRTFASDGRSKFSTWLVVVARRLCLDLHREHYGRSRDGQTDGARAAHAFRRRLQELAAEPTELATIPEPSESADALVLATELHDSLVAAVDALDARDQLLLQLRFEQGLTGAEIARLLEIVSPFHVYRRIESLLRTLRGSLKASGIENLHS
jgi:RNA polymerase sigma factor (sigma-70 family)